MTLLSLSEGESLPAFLEELRRRAWPGVHLSLAHDMVDEALLRLVSNEANAGALILSTPGPSLQASLLAERVGAHSLRYEPVDLEHLAEAIAAEQSNDTPIPVPPADPPELGLVGASPAMGPVFDLIARAAPSESTVLVTGESGTGKELVARALHEAGRRAGRPFVAINCAAIPEALLESELFGHERGAFTGAVAQRRGRFERANGGTLFLDEIGDMQPLLQAKLLRALEERVIERVGSDEPHPIDVRVVAATNRELSGAVADGSFREDLLYRLRVLEIELPPLRERTGDVRRLALHFAHHFGGAHGRPIEAISTRAMRELEAASWPGNVRELRNVIDRAVLLTSGPVIGPGALRLGDAAPRGAPTDVSSPAGYPTTASLAEVESDHIRRVLRAHEGQVSTAAEALGIHRNTLARKIRDYGLRPDER